MIIKVNRFIPTLHCHECFDVDTGYPHLIDLIHLNHPEQKKKNIHERVKFANSLVGNTYEIEEIEPFISLANGLKQVEGV